MGMIDSNAKLATAQVVTATGDTPGTNIYDCGSAHNASLGLSDELWIQAIVDTKATSGGAATVQGAGPGAAQGVCKGNLCGVSELVQQQWNNKHACGGDHGRVVAECAHNVFTPKGKNYG